MLWVLIIVAFLTVLLVIIQVSPLRRILERIDRERPQRNAQTADEVRQRPLTFVLTIAFSCASAFGLIYIFAFSDTAAERWRHFYVAFALVAFFGTCVAFAKKREDRGLLSFRVRRAIWGTILLCYAVAVAFILKFGSSPFARTTDTLRLICYLGSTAPLAYAAWQLFRSHEKGSPRRPENNARDVT